MRDKEFHKLGDYIREVDIRNRDLEVKELVGLTINKAFIPSVANTIGTDLSNYKVIRKEQFACSLMQVSRDEKMPVAMFEGECAIMSPAYPMFEVVDKNILLPQYLMMWFSRNEFDREASFYAVGGVRGSLTWQDFCDMTLPIPPIEQQRKIVAEYETISKRIRLNEQMITRLEETAQTLYRQMFVDGIDKENLPEGWRMGTLGEIADFKNGKAIKANDGIIPIYGGNGIVGYCSASNAKNVIIIGRVGINCGSIFLETKDCWVNDNAIIGIAHSDLSYYLYQTINRMDLNSQSEGSGQPLLTQAILNNQECIIPPQDIAVAFNTRIECVYKYLEILNEEQSILTELQSLLLAKMGQ